MTALRREARARPPRSALPRWKKALFGLVVIAAFFALLEAALALAGVRPVLATRDPFVGFAPLPLFVESDGPGGERWLTTAQNKLAYFNRQGFPKQKQPGTCRIFCLGGSTTYGHPYDDRASFAGWLRELLPSAMPERRFEVINAGGISYASYRVASLMEELSRYEPDLFIVYSGHNEFLEERTYGDIKAASPARLRIAAALAQTRSFTLLQHLLQPADRVPVEQLPSEVDAVLDHTVGPSSYHRDDELRGRVLEHFQFNLKRMIGMARAAGAGVVLVTPAANLKDCSPFKSEPGDAVSPSDRQQLQNHLQRGEVLERQGDSAAAVVEFQAAAELDPRYAEAHFRLASQLLALDRPVEAAAAFRRALEEDVCPVRAPPEISEIVRRVGRDWDVPVVDFVQLLQNESLRTYGHTIPGREYFLDHVHPTLAATGLLSVAIARQLAASGVIERNAFWSDAEIAEASLRIESRIDDAAEAVALRTLAKVLNWAGKHEEAGPLALGALETLPDDPESLVLAAAYVKTKGQTEQAIEYYRRALRHAPQYVEAHRLLAAALVEERQFKEALVHLNRLTELTPKDAHAWHTSGAVLAELGRYEEALERYRRALELAPADGHLHYNLGFALAQVGREQEAKSHFRRALELNPHDEDARRHLLPERAVNP